MQSILTSYRVDGRSSATFRMSPGSGRSIEASITLTMSAACIRETMVPSSDPANRMSPLCLCDGPDKRSLSC